MKALIAELEAATEPSRELDAQFAVAVRSTGAAGDKSLPEWASKNFEVWRARSDGRVELVHNDGTGGLNWEPLHFSSSLDDVVTSLPENCISWTVSDSPAGPTARVLMDSGMEFEGFPKPGHGTPALVLCIASLKARDHEPR